MPSSTRNTPDRGRRAQGLEPRRKLAYEPVIDGYDDLDAAIEELAFLKSRRETREKALEQQVALLKSEAAKDLTVKVGRHEMPIAEREADVREVVETYCRQNRGQLLEEWGGKSRKFTHGEISFREQPEGVKFLDGENEASVIAKIEQRAEETKGILGRIWDVLKAWHLFRNVPVSVFVEPKLFLAKSRILASYRQREIEREDLESVGLVVNRGPDSLTIKINEYLVQREVQE